MVLFRLTNLKSCKDERERLETREFEADRKEEEGLKTRDRYLDPGEEDYDGGNVVKLDLQIGQRLKAGVSRVVLQQPFEKNPNHRCPRNVHDDRNDAQLSKEGESTDQKVAKPSL